jgi:coenzyme Q-binding protein COQ10
MMVGYGALRERYTSRVVLDPSLLRVDVAQISGPFRKLENHWRFTALDGHRCEINFSIVFEFHNRILAAVAARSFEKALLRMTEAFETRAAALSRFPA